MMKLIIKKSTRTPTAKLFREHTNMAVGAMQMAVRLASYARVLLQGWLGQYSRTGWRRGWPWVGARCARMTPTIRAKPSLGRGRNTRWHYPLAATDCNAQRDETTRKQSPKRPAL